MHMIHIIPNTPSSIPLVRNKYISRDPFCSPKINYSVLSRRYPMPRELPAMIFCEFKVLNINIPFRSESRSIIPWHAMSSLVWSCDQLKDVCSMPTCDYGYICKRFVVKGSLIIGLHRYDLNLVWIKLRIYLALLIWQYRETSNI